MFSEFLFVKLISFPMKSSHIKNDMIEHLSLSQKIDQMHVFRIFVC